MIRHFLCLVCLALSVTAARATDIMIMDATARASLTPTAKNGAAYLAIMNHGAENDTLLTVTCTCAQSATLHETLVVDDVVKMRALEGGVAIPGGQTVAFKSGGTHIMLDGLFAPLVKGEKTKLSLFFEKAGRVDVELPVGDVGSEHVHKP